MGDGVGVDADFEVENAFVIQGLVEKRVIVLFAFGCFALVVGFKSVFGETSVNRFLVVNPEHSVNVVGDFGNSADKGVVGFAHSRNSFRNDFNSKGGFFCRADLIDNVIFHSVVVLGGVFSVCLMPLIYGKRSELLIVLTQFQLGLYGFWRVWVLEAFDEAYLF